MSNCPDCDPTGSKAAILEVYGVVVTNGMAFYANPQTPACFVKTPAELGRDFCGRCAKERGFDR